jgi:hypothetical protein
MMHYQLTVFCLVALALLIATAQAYNAGASCLNAQSFQLDQQERVCDLDSPYCVYSSNGFSKGCAECKIQPALTEEQQRGGSCSCDASTHFCSQDSNTNTGLCVPYTIAGFVCSDDSHCRTTVSVITASGTISSGVNERLYCVNGACKPCKPSAWVAAGVTNVTCPGYDPAVSTILQRYASRSRLPASVYTCTEDGDIVWLSGGTTATSDYDYGYSCGDRALWPQDCNPTPTPSAAPSGTTAPSQSSGPSSAASALQAGVALAAVCLALVCA